MMKKNRLLYVLTFTCPMLLFLTVLYFNNLYPFNSKTTLFSGDYLHQYIGIFAGYKRMVESLDLNKLYWSFNKSLGLPTAAMWGYYVGGSPLNLLYVFFPMDKIYIATTLIIILKHGLMGLSFSYLLTHTTMNNKKNPIMIFLFSMVYSFSGFVVAQANNPMFHDNLILLPILILLLEKLIEGDESNKTKLLYVGTLTMIIFVHFYIGYMICIFIVIYGLGYSIMKYDNLRLRIHSYIRLGILSLLSLCISCIILLPIIFSLIDSKGVLINSDFSFLNIIADPVKIFAKFFIGTSTSREWGVNSSALPHLFVGSLSLFGLIIYLNNHHNKFYEKIGLLITLGILYISFVFELGDRVWHMGARPYGFFFRNSWAMNFVMILYAYRGFETYTKLKFRDFYKIILCCLFIVVGIYGLDIGVINNTNYFITMIFWIILLMLLLFPISKLRSSLLLAITIVELALNAFLIFDSYDLYFSISSFEDFLSKSEVLSEVLPNKNNNFFRLEMSNRNVKANQAFIDDYYGVAHSSSSIEAFLIYGLSNLGLPGEKAFQYYTSRTPLTDALLNISYYVTNEIIPNNQSDIKELYEFIGNYGDQSIFKNKYNLNLGFLVTKEFNNYSFYDKSTVSIQQDLLNILFDDNYKYFYEIPFDEVVVENLTRDVNGYHFHSIDQSLERKIKLYFSMKNNGSYYLSIPYHSKYQFKQGSALLDKKPYNYNYYFSKDQLWNIGLGENSQHEFEIVSNSINTFTLKDLSFYYFDIEKFKENILLKQDSNIDIVDYSDGHVNGVVNVTNPKLSSAFFSIPYSKGWKAKVNGKEAQVYSVWDTFIGINLDEGSNSIELRYEPPGLKEGAMISSIGIVMLLLELNINKLIRLRKYLFGNEKKTR